MAKKAKRKSAGKAAGMAASKSARRATRIVRRAWSGEDNRELKRYSKAKTAVAQIARTMSRTAGALRQQARKLGIPLGHRR
jgi:hypothetical protein